MGGLGYYYNEMAVYIQFNTRCLTSSSSNLTAEDCLNKATAKQCISCQGPCMCRFAFVQFVYVPSLVKVFFEYGI